MDDFSTQLTLRIEWSEIDLFGHVNNVAIMRYVQAARVHYLETVGLMQLQSETGLGPILAYTNCRFHKPLFYPGEVTVCSRVDLVKNTSFRIAHVIFDKSRRITAESQDIIVFYDFRNETKVTIPPEIREKIEVREQGAAEARTC